jgi:hypothetical protein
LLRGYKPPFGNLLKAAQRRENHRKASLREVSNAEKNVAQRVVHQQPGGIAGRGFLPGRSGNLNGRPRTRGRVSALP